MLMAKENHCIGIYLLFHIDFRNRVWVLQITDSLQLIENEQAKPTGISQLKTDNEKVHESAFRFYSCGLRVVGQNRM